MPKGEMVTYQLIERLEELGLFRESVLKGVISCNFIDYKLIYERYVEYRRSHNKMDSYELTSMDYAVHLNTVRRVVSIMES